MKAIRRHYRRVAEETALVEGEDRTLPSRVRAIVLVSKVHKPTLRALAFAKAARPSTLEALTVDVDPAETERLVQAWEDAEIDIPLKVVASPYREVTNPIIDYVRNMRTESPRDVVTVYIPEYVVGRWWEQILHNQSALRLKGRLLFTPGVMVTSVPYLLKSSSKAEQRLARETASENAPVGICGAAVSRPTRTGSAEAAREPFEWHRVTSSRSGQGPAGAGRGRRIAHGGHCVARYEGRVIFVRHALPGERVLVQITDDSHDRFWRADAVQVLRPSADRVAPPCPIAGPGLCGGCDFQHVDLAAQRRLKAEVVAEQLRRLAGIDWAGVVEAGPHSRHRRRARLAHPDALPRR